MSKLAKKVTVIDSPFSVSKSDGKEVFVLRDSFKREVLATANEFGGFIQTAAQKIQTSMNLVLSFNEYKRITKGGLPAFVHDCLDSDCPNVYGKPGSKERRDIVGHKLFVGIEYMVKKGKLAIAAINERKALSDAGIDPENNDKVRDHNAAARTAKLEKFTKDFCKAMVDFSRHGVTDTTVENFIITVLRKKEKESDDLNKAGITLRDAAMKAVLKAQNAKA